MKPSPSPFEKALAEVRWATVRIQLLALQMRQGPQAPEVILLSGRDRGDENDGRRIRRVA